MTTIHDFKGQKIALTKGAPDVILDLCTKILVKGDEKKLTDKMRKEILEKNSDFASQAYRVLGLSYKPVPEGYDHDNLEKDLVFTGLAAVVSLLPAALRYPLLALHLVNFIITWVAEHPPA